MERRCGDEERKGIEGMHERFMKLVGLDWRIPRYIVRKEMGRKIMRGRTEKKTLNFERRLEKGEK